jgi:hypothetical protein
VTTVAGFWDQAYDRQVETIADIQRAVPTMKPGSALLLDGECPYIGPGTVFVFGDPITPSCPLGCPWTAAPSVSWIRVTSSMPRAGDDLLRYEVEPNTTGQSRTGEIRVDRLVLTVRQGG